jgi:hypothetical protein
LPSPFLPRIQPFLLFNLKVNSVEKGRSAKTYAYIKQA